MIGSRGNLQWSVRVASRSYRGLLPGLCGLPRGLMCGSPPGPREQALRPKFSSGATSISLLNFNIQILISNKFQVGTAFRILNLPSLLSHHSDSMARWPISSLWQSFCSLTLFLSFSSETLCFCFRILKDGVVNYLVSIFHHFSCHAIPSTVIGYKIVPRLEVWKKRSMKNSPSLDVCCTETCNDQNTW